MIAINEEENSLESWISKHDYGIKSKEDGRKEVKKKSKSDKYLIYNFFILKHKTFIDFCEF